MGNNIRRIVNVMSMCPPYELYWNEDRPEANWDLSDGQWVGMWSNEWLDLIGAEVLKRDKDLRYEVWQPDVRADKIYTHIFPSGVVHRLFPAMEAKEFYGVKRILHVKSPTLYDALMNENKQSDFLLRVDHPAWRIGRDILQLGLICPKIIQYFGEFKPPLNNLFSFEKNLLSKLNRIFDHFALRRYLSMADIVTYTSEYNRRNLTRYYSKEMLSLSIGVDFDFWTRGTGKNSISESLNLRDSGKLLLTSARLVDAKQIDRVIMILNELDSEFDFLLVVSGHGEASYEQYLKVLGRELIRKDKLRFVGYLKDAQLRDLYAACDLFIMSSLSEAGPTATIKALAMEVPVLSTNTGQMAEVLADHDAGLLVPICDYAVWKMELREFLQGKEVRILDRGIVEKIHHWPNVANQYIDLYDSLYQRFFD